MSESKTLRPSQKRKQKLVYLAAWGASAAYSGAMVATNFSISKSLWFLALAAFAAVSFSSTVMMQASYSKATSSLVGVVVGIIGGGILGELVLLAHGFYPWAMMPAIGVTIVFVTSGALEVTPLAATKLTRWCLVWALVLSLLFTGTAILLGGTPDSTILQAFFGALLASWGALAAIAALDS